jgi:hypothetical protein
VVHGTSKFKFNPRIKRIRLNPEQAVLQCDCWSTGWGHYGTVEGDIGPQWYYVYDPSLPIIYACAKGVWDPKPAGQAGFNSQGVPTPVPHTNVVTSKANS